MNRPARTSPPDPARLSQQAVHTVLRAARYALRSYPGPIGELIDRELRAYIDTGHELPPTALPERLLATLIAAAHRSAASTDPLPPARYMRGTPLHWEYPAGIGTDQP
jgi:hypothetical protein